MTEKRQSKGRKPGEHNKVTPLKMTQKDQNGVSVPMQDLLGDKLRAYYDQVAREPVPDRFELLLKELEARSMPKKLS
jgi:DNA-binding protein Fis